VLEPSDPGVLAVLRRHPLGPMMGLYNMTEQWRPWPAERLAFVGLGDAVDRLSGERVLVSDDGQVWLGPYAALWVLDVATEGR
jgi:amylosucrase